jgi:hypothetical protein
MDVYTLGQDIRVKASGGDAMIVNPSNMEVLSNDYATDSWLRLQAGQQLMLSGMYNNDVFLVVVESSEDFANTEGTFGIVLRKASWNKVLEASVVG